jgi:hypothetical protein
VKQRLRDRLFQSLHFHAERGLRPADLQGGQTDGADTGHNDEIPQEDEIQHQYQSD